MALGDIYRLTMGQTLHGQGVQNVFHYKQVAGDNGENSDLLLAVFIAEVVPVVKAFQSQEVNHDLCIAQRVNPLPPLVAAASTASVGPGAVAGASVPSSVASVVTKIGKFATRDNLGRTYFAGLPEADHDNSRIIGPSQGRLGDIANALVTTLQDANGNQYDLVLYDPQFQTHVTVERCIARLILRNQKRRQVGVGL